MPRPAQVMDAMPHQVIRPPRPPVSPTKSRSLDNSPKHDYVNDACRCESSYQTGDKNMVLKQTASSLRTYLAAVCQRKRTSGE